MSFKAHTRRHHTYEYTTQDGRTLELSLPYEPSSTNDYKETLIYEMNGKVLLGYLVDDQDCTNPLEDSDGYGHIYTSHRNARREEHENMQDALGLDRNWEPDLDLVGEEEVVKFCQNIIRVDGVNPDILVFCDETWERQDEESDLDFVLRCLEDIEDFTEFFDLEDIRTNLWKEGRLNGTIGNPYAVSLDVYEHSGISYSVSGQGMQCQFDTARGGAVWVPDEVCTDEIKSRGEFYRKGKITKSMVAGREFYRVRTWEKFGLFDKVNHPEFTHWIEAFKYLEVLELRPEQFLQELADGEHDAACELAKQACEVYTDWCNGNCFGIVVCSFDISQAEDGDEVEQEAGEEVAVWGFIGDDYAYESLKEEFDGWKNRL